MQKKELAREIAKATGDSIVKTEGILDELQRIIEKRIATRGECPFPGIGKFRVKKQPAMVITNPNGDRQEIPERVRVKFSVYKSFENEALQPKS